MPFPSRHNKFFWKLSNLKGTICYLVAKWNTGNSMKTKTIWRLPTKPSITFYFGFDFDLISWNKNTWRKINSMYPNIRFIFYQRRCNQAILFVLFFVCLFSNQYFEHLLFNCAISTEWIEFKLDNDANNGQPVGDWKIEGKKILGTHMERIKKVCYLCSCYVGRIYKRHCPHWRNNCNPNRWLRLPIDSHKSMGHCHVDDCKNVDWIGGCITPYESIH